MRLHCFRRQTASSISAVEPAKRSVSVPCSRAPDRNRRRASSPRPPRPASACRVAAVVGQVGNVGIRYEAPCAGVKPVEAGRAAPAISRSRLPCLAPDVAVGLVAAVEGGKRRMLAERRHRNEEVLGQPLDRPHQLVRHDPAPASSRSSRSTLEAVDHNGMVGDFDRRSGFALVHDAMIDRRRSAHAPCVHHSANAFSSSGSPSSRSDWTGAGHDQPGDRPPPSRARRDRAGIRSAAESADRPLRD